MKLGSNGGSVGALMVSVPSKLPLKGTSVAADGPAKWSPAICVPFASPRTDPTDGASDETDVGPVGEAHWLQAEKSGTNRTAAVANRISIVISSG
jgi:hypothetical protein